MIIYSVQHYLGTASLLQDHPSIVEASVVDNSTDKLCQKDFGSSNRLRRWSKAISLLSEEVGTSTLVLPSTSKAV